MSATPLPDSSAPHRRFPPPPRRVELRPRGWRKWLGRLLLFNPCWLFICSPMVGIGVRGVSGPMSSRSAAEWLASTAFLLLLLGVALFPLAASVAELVLLLRRRRVYRHGAEAAGVVRSRRSEAGETTSYHVVYSFVDATGIERTPPECQLDLGPWNELREGQAVAVLYDPARPELCYLYEGEDDQIVPAAR